MMSHPGEVLRSQIEKRLNAVLTAAMRADPAGIGSVIQERGVRDALDAQTRDFLDEARMMVLGCAAALTNVLDTHRFGTDPYGGELCLGCRSEGPCKTLRRVGQVLTAYLSDQRHVIDRAEAWRRAEIWFGQSVARPFTVAVEDLGEGYLAHTVAYAPEVTGPVLIVDRATGGLSQWPPLPREVLAREYARYRAARFPEQSE